MTFHGIGDRDWLELTVRKEFPFQQQQPNLFCFDHSCMSQNNTTYLVFPITLENKCQR